MYVSELRVYSLGKARKSLHSCVVLKSLFPFAWLFNESELWMLCMYVNESTVLRD